MHQPTPAPPAVSFLLYHEIGTEPRPSANLDCFCRVGRFREQMRFLKERAIPVLRAADACAALAGAGAALAQPVAHGVVLTFDDGDTSFLEHALPVLEEYGFPATVFAVAGLLGERARWARDARNAVPLMTAAQLHAIAGRGIEIGSHAMTHRKLPELSPDDAGAELRDSRRLLEDVLGAPVTSLAYPHGRHDSVTRALAAAAGYRYAYGTDGGHRADLRRGRYQLPRKYITYHDGLAEFAARVCAWRQAPG